VIGGTKKHATHHTMRRTPSLIVAQKSSRIRLPHQVGEWKKSKTKHHNLKHSSDYLKKLKYEIIKFTISNDDDMYSNSN